MSLLWVMTSGTRIAGLVETLDLDPFRLERDGLDVALFVPDPGDVKFFLDADLALDDQHLFEHRNDQGVAFMAVARRIAGADDAVDGDVFDAQLSAAAARRW